MAEKKQPRNEFRKHKPSGHVKHIYEKDGDSYKFLGITHSPTSKGVKNIQLEQNPKPNAKDPRPSFVETQSETDKQKKFKEIEKGWKFGEKDKDKVKKIIKDNKKRSAPSKSKH